MANELHGEPNQPLHYFDLCNLINEYKREVTLNEFIERACNEGWYNRLRRIGQTTVLRAIERHNAKYK